MAHWIRSAGLVFSAAQVCVGFFWGWIEVGRRWPMFKPRPPVAFEDYRPGLGGKRFLQGLGWMLLAALSAAFYLPGLPLYAAYRWIVCCVEGFHRVAGVDPDVESPALER